VLNYDVHTVTDKLMHTVYICMVLLTITIDSKISGQLTLYSNLLFSECLQCVGLSLLLLTWKPLKESASLFQGFIDPVGYCLRCYWFVWFQEQWNWMLGCTSLKHSNLVTFSYIHMQALYYSEIAVMCKSSKEAFFK